MVLLLRSMASSSSWERYPYEFSAALPMSDQPPKPLDHRVRRCILRQLHKDFLPHTTAKLSRDLELDESEVRYHGRVLAKWQKVREAEGPYGLFLESLVAEDPEVIAALIATRTEDERR